MDDHAIEAYGTGGKKHMASFEDDLQMYPLVICYTAIEKDHLYWVSH